ncbi:MAG: extracellular solute-binding protein [Chloroflexi bacterium]|nr:extracellular solute-binding protein [Chloroflexota bacterium]
MSRTIRIVLPFLLALSLILAGCAQPTAAPAPQGPADTEEQPAEAPAEVSEPAGEPAAEEEPEAEEITLTYWAVVPTQLQFDALYERFQELYPNIKIDFRQFQDAGEYGQQLAPALSSGEGPDMFMVFNNQVNRFENFTEPVEERLNAEWGSDWQDLFIPVAIPGATSSSGKIVGIPIGVESQEYILYNQTLAEELGIQMPPKNYEELVAIVNQVRESGQDIIPLALGAKDKWHITGFYIQIANQFGPGKVYQAEAGEIPWTDPALVDAMKAWKQMFDDGLFQEGAVGLATYPDARDQYYYSRKALMFPTGSWHVGSYALPPNGEKMGTAIEGDATNAFLFPQIGPYESVATASISWIQAINKDAPAEKKEAAWKWFDYFTKDEGAQIFTDLLQASPVVKGMTPRTLDQLPFESDRESVRMLVDALANAQGAMRFQYPELEEAVGTALQEVATGQKTPEEALQDVQAVSDLIER